MQLTNELFAHLDSVLASQIQLVHDSVGFGPLIRVITLTESLSTNMARPSRVSSRFVPSLPFVSLTTR